MKHKFKFSWTKELERQYKFYRKDKKTLKKIDETILIILENPFTQSLRTHQVNISVIGKC
jgi:Txe/YoeB family toxin of Txe-Axe toxin-antitoxin module